MSRCARESPRCDSVLQISVLLVTGDEVARLAVRPHQTVRALKKQIEATDGTRMDCQKLLAGMSLLSNRETVAEAGLIDGGSIQLVRLPPPSGVSRGKPGYEPTEEQLDSYAEHLGMSLIEDRDLLWIAEEGLKAPLPAGWQACNSESNGLAFFYNIVTGESQWEHPLDEEYRNKYQQRKVEAVVTQSRAHAHEREERWAETLAEAECLVKTVDEATEAEVEAYAGLLGMSADEDKDFFWIAEDGLRSCLPPDWRRFLSKSGHHFYCHMTTNQSQWEHPLADMHRAQYQTLKAGALVAQMHTHASDAETYYAETLAEAAALVKEQRQSASPQRAMPQLQAPVRVFDADSLLRSPLADVDSSRRDVVWERRWHRPSKRITSRAEMMRESTSPSVCTSTALRPAAEVMKTLPSLPCGAVSPFGRDAWRSMNLSEQR